MQRKEFTNHYANQCVELTEGETSVEIISPDNIKRLLNPA